MTHPIALTLGLLIAVVLVADIVMFGDEHMIFLGKKFLEFMEWIAFWR